MRHLLAVPETPRLPPPAGFCGGPFRIIRDSTNGPVCVSIYHPARVLYPKADRSAPGGHSGHQPAVNNKGIAVVTEDIPYNLEVVRWFAVMTVVWGIVGMAVGVLIAGQLAWPVLNFDLPWLSYGRLRPLHTNAVIFAFGGCALMGTALYVVQRTCRTPLFSNGLAKFVFFGWQTVILLAAITLPMGLTTTKEYAELEWPIDILIAIVWVSFGVVFFGTIARRRVEHIYVANWFYGALIIGVAVLHIFNSLALPVSLTKSYSIYAGSVDAMVQWW
ncbi:MAG: cbb3-type cytochrome c oxidase subunit I, partial [Pseudomonadales bacterium]|nr:cbb3-type cytochrome c oxidase subunit I [Pseudomonadales bacterium]